MHFVLHNYTFLAFVIITFLRTACKATLCNHQPQREFQRAENRELQKMWYRQAVTPSRVLCVRNCHADPDCKSVNFNKNTRICQLNNSTWAQHRDNFVSHYGSVYFDSDENTTLTSLRLYSSCNKLLEAGHYMSGIYTIFPARFRHGLQVYCDMETDGGGWIVIQRRQDGSMDFYRNWTDYQVGFGSLSGEFWIGNDNLRILTESTEPWQLRVDLENWNNKTAFAEYGEFSISGEKYKLNIKSYNPHSTAADSVLTTNDGHSFSTKDEDNDLSPGLHCAEQYPGAWWYGMCTSCNLNCMYFNTESSAVESVKFTHWNNGKSIKKCSMKIRNPS